MPPKNPLEEKLVKLWQFLHDRELSEYCETVETAIATIKGQNQEIGRLYTSLMIAGGCDVEL